MREIVGYSTLTSIDPEGMPKANAPCLLCQEIRAVSQYGFMLDLYGYILA